MIAPHATNIQGVKIPPAYCRKDLYLEVLCSKCISPQWLTEKLGLGRTPVREAIQRPDVRWKDLRGIFATYYLLAGGEPRELQRILGHGTMAMTLRYLNNTPAGNRKGLKEMACKLGLPGGRHLNIAKEG